MKSKINSIFYHISVLFFIFLPFSAETSDFGTLPLTEFYAHDTEAALNENVVVQKETKTYTLYEIEYDSVWGQRVPALFLIPKTASPPYPCVVFGHGFTGNKSNAEPIFEPLSKMGVSLLSIDFWYHGARKIEGVEMYSKHLYRMREGLAASVIDLRRGVDFLESRPEIDPERIGYVGASMGGIIGAIFAGVEKRVQAPVLVVGGGNWPYLISHSVVAQVLFSSSYSETRAIARVASRILPPVDPLNFAHSISPRPVLMLNAKHDILVNPASAKSLFDRALSPKKQIWFKAGHELPFDDVIKPVSEWINKYLINKEVPDFNTSVEGYKTSPIVSKREKKRQPPITDISYGEYFNYNHDMPLLSYRMQIKSFDPRISVFKIKYHSVHEREVRGVLNLPTVGVPPYPCVIFVHDIGGSKEDVDLLSGILAANGVATVSIDVYDSRNRHGALKGMEIGKYELRNMLIQGVFDVRRLLDFLDKISEIHNQSYSVIGVGYGGVVSVASAGLDERIMNLIVMNLGSDMKKILEHEGYSVVKYDGELTSERINDFNKTMKLLEPANYLKKMSPRPTLFVHDDNGSMFTLESALNLYEAAQEPKEMIRIGEGNEAGTTDIFKGILLFLKNALTDRDGMIVIENKRKIFVDPDVLALARDKDSNENKEEKIAVVNLEIKEVEREGQGEILLKARVDDTEKKGASIIASVKCRGNTRRYVSLVDSGQGADRKKDDGVFTGILRNIFLDEGDKCEVFVGGLGGNGEAVQEIVKEIQH